VAQLQGAAEVRAQLADGRLGGLHSAVQGLSHGGQFGGCLVVSGETVSELLGEELLQNLSLLSAFRPMGPGGLGEFRQGLRIPQEGLLCGLGLAFDGLQPLALCLELLLALLGAEQGEGAASLPDLQVFDLWTKSFIDFQLQRSQTLMQVSMTFGALLLHL